MFTFTQVNDQCVMALDGYSGSWEHKLSNKELNFARVLTVVKKRRDYKLQVESHGVFGVAAVLMG